MPELDTYHILERFASDSSDIEARQAYLFLKRRTELTVKWRMLGMIDRAPLPKLAEIYLGTKDRSERVAELETMSEPAREDLYKWACEQAGVKIDPSLFTKDK